MLPEFSKPAILRSLDMDVAKWSIRSLLGVGAAALALLVTSGAGAATKPALEPGVDQHISFQGDLSPIGTNRVVLFSTKCTLTTPAGTQRCVLTASGTIASDGSVAGTLHEVGLAGGGSVDSTFRIAGSGCGTGSGFEIQPGQGGRTAVTIDLFAQVTGRHVAGEIDVYRPGLSGC
jgi:hypothetical protein